MMSAICHQAGCTKPGQKFTHVSGENRTRAGGNAGSRWCTMHLCDRQPGSCWENRPSARSSGRSIIQQSAVSPLWTLYRYLQPTPPAWLWLHGKKV